MRQTILGLVSLVFLCSTALPSASQAATSAQTPTSQAPQAPLHASPRVENRGVPNQPKPPDMVCFGYYPNWSVQFVNGDARYVGYDEPDQYFAGHFYWFSKDNAWDWHPSDNAAPANDNSYNMSAWIEKAECRDVVLNATMPYSAQVYLPQGDMVSGCCRKLKPGEAIIGRHGVPPADAGPNVSAPAPQQRQMRQGDQ